jgi:hypothetical protein
MKLSSPFSFIRKASQPAVDVDGAKPRQGDSEFSLTREANLGLEAKSRHVPNVFQRLFRGVSGNAPSRAQGQTRQPTQAPQSTRSSFTMPRRIEPRESSKSTSSKVQGPDSGSGHGASAWSGAPVEMEKQSRQGVGSAVGHHVNDEQKLATSQTHSKSRYSTKIVHSWDAFSQSRQSSKADSDRTMIRYSSFSQDSRHSSCGTVLYHEEKRPFFSQQAISQSQYSLMADSDRTMLRRASFSLDSRRFSLESPFSHNTRHHFPD